MVRDEKTVRDGKKGQKAEEKGSKKMEHSKESMHNDSSGKNRTGGESPGKRPPDTEAEISSSIFYWHSFLLFCGRLLHSVLDFYNRLFDMSHRDKAKIYSNISRHYSNKGLHDKALEYLKKWTRIDPSNVEAHYRLGVALAASGNKKSALRVFSRVLTLEPEHMGALHRKSSILLRVKDYKGALEDLEKAIEIRKDNPDLLYLYAIALEGVGDIDKAIQSLKQAIELDPDEIKYHQHLGFLNVSRDDHQTAAKSFSRVMELERELDEDEDMHVSY